MDIKSTLAAQGYAATRPATQPKAGESGGAGEAFARLAGDFAETLNRGEQVASASMIGNADPHALVQALAQTELAVETAVTVRNKVVEAYQEILRMPV
ncbi:flagellar hook-basal body complex protein FliE [Sinisalibacter aestuarii]|uniref:Flagellar hook-basal body complex protein FliE n=1 Tax=Sinisalibacter aestuarii TaxID=2949426 RepID=A0ABQ5LQZ7_9RHOB|nr:flagellar hook-basal body complex protein FliE [Sinisalibacter aestuarii]GKY86691.1 flagellar hook-basal body complex protein FliE [Sinisalibacter aestuarii]